MSSKLSTADAAAVIAREDQGQAVEMRDALGNPILDTDTGKSFTISVAGSHSSVYRRALAAVRTRRANARGTEVDRAQTEFVAACVLAWSEIAIDDQPCLCTKENVVKLLTLCPWFQRQLEEAMHDHEGFTRSPSAS